MADSDRSANSPNHANTKNTRTTKDAKNRIFEPSSAENVDERVFRINCLRGLRMRSAVGVLVSVSMVASWRRVRARPSRAFVGRDVQSGRAPAADGRHGLGRPPGPGRGRTGGAGSQRGRTWRALSAGAGLRRRHLRAARRLHGHRQADHPGSRAGDHRRVVLERVDCRGPGRQRRQGADARPDFDGRRHRQERRALTSSRASSRTPRSRSAKASCCSRNSRSRQPRFSSRTTTSG